MEEAEGEGGGCGGKKAGKEEEKGGREKGRRGERVDKSVYRWTRDRMGS